jgi:hypothetical protein
VWVTERCAAADGGQAGRLHGAMTSGRRRRPRPPRVEDPAREAGHDVPASPWRLCRLEGQIARIGRAEQAQLVVRHLLAVRTPDRSERDGCAHRQPSGRPLIRRAPCGSRRPS